MQHHRGTHYAVVILVQVVVVGGLEVSQHEHSLKLCILPVTKLFDIVGLDAWLVDVL